MILNILHILNILKVFLQKRDPQLNCLWALFQARRCEVWKAGKVSEDYLRFFVGNPGIDNSHLGIVNMASGDSHMIIQYSFMISSLYPYDIPRKYHDISTNLSLKIWSGPPATVGLGQHSLWDSIPVVVPRLAAQVPDGNRALELGTRMIWGIFLRKTWNIVYWTRNGKLFNEQSRIVWWFLFFCCGYMWMSRVWTNR